MKNNLKFCLPLLSFFVLQCFPLFTNGQVTFEKVYPTTINQSGRDALPTSDGGYLLVGMTTTNIAGDSDIYVIKTDNTGNILWTKTLGGVMPDYVYSFIPTSDGNYFILGFTMSYGAGGYDTWLVKIDPAATILWSKTYGTSGNEAGHEIVPTSDGNYMITGHWNNDAFLLKIDPAGTMLWTKTYGGPQYETSHSVKQTIDGGYILAGQTYSYGKGAGDIYIVRTNSVGDTTWTKTFGGIYPDEGSYVLANTDGTFIIDGETSTSNAQSGLDISVIKTDANGGAIWNKTYGGNDKDVTHMIQPTSDGGYIIAGISRSFNWINPDMWLVKTDGAGNVMWTNNFGSWYHDHCYAVRQTADGGYIAVGHQEDSNTITHVFFVKLDGSGQVAIETFAFSDLLDVYPNPTSGIVKIDLKNSLEEKTTIRIYNAIGQIMFSEVVDASSSVSSKVIDLKDKDRGIYFVSLQSSKNIITKKIILE